MFNVSHLIQSGGLLLVGTIVFAETGLLVGFFLPGDTLLFTAGFFAAQGKLPLPLLLIVIIGAAIAGDNVGYTIGKRMGPRIFRKKDGLFFRQEYIEQSEKFYERHGGKTILFARFVPIVRTFNSVVAGVGKMPRRRFVMFDTVGATIWGGGVTLLGFWLGSRIPNIDKYLLPAIIGATLLAFSPTLWHLFKDRQRILAKLWRKK